MNNDKNYAEGMLKGRMAETLVDELLKKSGNTVYRFGYEAILQNLTQITKRFEATSEVGQRIRAIPDFVVLDEESNPIFVEVKFRWNGKLHENDKASIERIKHFWNAKMIFVNCFERPFFQVSDAPYTDDEGNLITKPLIDDSSWKIDPEVYKEFELLVEKYMSPTLTKSNLSDNKPE